ncbi:c-type cytochrome biogenesis protein CcmI [Ruegeria faecimaris]|uniref:c-type cytochrome biogenesis protein CcmI n=1 Tax=Ruegeria faecimaris TaxID=686389 RepID=UPI00232C4613|nr:c-type cytochrome biogenesis protein CcmI [Ruegeria faecimaris]
MIWIIFSIIASVVFLMLAHSGMCRNTSNLSRRDSASAIFADQIGEVEKDLERGIISAEEAKAARAEIESRLKAIDRQSDGGEPMVGHSGRVLVLLAALTVPALGAGVYWQLGSPDIPSQPFAQRTGEQAEVRKIADLAVRLRSRLEADETGGPTEGWVLLAQTYMRMGRFGEAADAFEVLLDRPDASSALVSQYGEALVYSEDGIVTPKAERAFDRALELDPSNPAATFYIAVGLEQAGSPDKAYDLLKTRMEAEEGFRPWMESFAAQLNRIAPSIGRAPVDLAALAPSIPGPTADQVAATEEMSDEDRQVFIRSMVERLANRMKENPSDLDGWMRLGNAYAVLGENENARNAYGKAQKLAENLSQTDPRKAEIARSLAELGA